MHVTLLSSGSALLLGKLAWGHSIIYDCRSNRSSPLVATRSRQLKARNGRDEHGAYCTQIT
jgi:hypothetical protein